MLAVTITDGLLLFSSTCYTHVTGTDVLQATMLQNYIAT